MAKVKATLTAGRNGGRAVAWIAGVPQGFTRQYVFPAGQPLDIDEADADALAAGSIDLGGRVIVVARGPGKPVAATIPAGDWPAPAPAAAPKAKA